MTLHRIALLAVASFTAAVQLTAQVSDVRLRDAKTQLAECVGPGAALGVLAYQCASCGFKREKGRTLYSFNAEPVITQVTATSVLRAGDVIEAVGGKPITTAEGADAFAYPADPAAGRGPALPQPAEIERVEVIKGAAAARLYGIEATNGVISVVTKSGSLVARVDTTAAALQPIAAMLARQMAAVGRQPLLIVDGVVQPWPVREIAVRVRRDGKSVTLIAPVMDRCDGDSKPASSPRDSARTLPAGVAAPNEPAGRFGLAVSCEPTCTKARARDGTDYWRFDGYPPIVALLPSGPAERVGLKVGDRVTDIDGISILTEQGALRFLRNESKDSMQVTVLRGGEKIGYLVSLRVRLRTGKPGT
jgi:TonB-dependent SusC/RagA subfamily outer membrane receptor